MAVGPVPVMPAPLMAMAPLQVGQPGQFEDEVADMPVVICVTGVAAVGLTMGHTSVLGLFSK